MTICIACTDNEIDACYPVIQALRPELKQEHFLARIRNQEKMGYKLAFRLEAGRPVAVAGFRFIENLAWGRFLYVDDLVTLPAERSRGYGTQMLCWLREHARQEGCTELHLDSGSQRIDAHRFYLREGMTHTGLHFAQQIATIKS